MDRRSRRAGGRLRAMALVAALAGLVLPAGAAAQVPSDLTDWNLTETTSTWGSTYHVSSSGGGPVQYRWLDTPAKATVVSGNSCSDLSLFGSPATIAINDTTYKLLFTGYTDLCFRLRGRTTSGSGSMVNHDGRVSR
ncbi:hypothetical protein OJ997_00435 [Solirubrobacter phytolaccae]|uniref:Uncharacterized protein n=1 Tax=Solirubrobacter phytolaccae TaxID=1404360 RepID=A0A9X3S913_9ACTN|nr:hypothetical protein [Solirubrobacter phytolaccae]MDA0178745.1 hypothetical protein [Solirubrobacter phytolaccae]